MGSSGMKRKGRKHQPKVGTRPERDYALHQSEHAVMANMGVGSKGWLFWGAIAIVVMMVSSPSSAWRSGSRSGAEACPVPAPELEQLAVDVGRRHLQIGIGDLLPVEADAVLHDLAAPLLVRRHGLRERGATSVATRTLPSRTSPAGIVTSGTSSGVSCATNTRSNSDSAAAPAPSPWYTSTTVRASSRFGVAGEFARLQRTGDLRDPYVGPARREREVLGHGLVRE